VRILVGTGVYLLALSVSLGTAFLLQGYTIRHAFAYETDKALYVSMTPMDPDSLARLAKVAEADPRTRAHLAAQGGEEARFINYVMPWEWSVPEIPMNNIQGHHTPKGWDARKSKIVYTRAVFSRGDLVEGREILRRALRTVPVAEVWIEEGRIARVLDPPRTLFFGPVPVPLF
jgi:hypothetical protein